MSLKYKRTIKTGSAREDVLYTCGIQRHFILRYPTIPLADSEGPDQTARAHRLIWAFAVRCASKTHFYIAGLIYNRWTLRSDLSANSV